MVCPGSMVMRKMSARSLLMRSGRTDRRRHRLDALRVEIGPDDAGADDVVAIGGEPALDRLVGRVREREHDPVRVGAWRLRRHGDAARHAVGGRRRLDLQAVAARIVESPSVVISTRSWSGSMTMGFSAKARPGRATSSAKTAKTR